MALIRPAARLGVISTNSATCSSTMMPPMVGTSQATVRVVVKMARAKDSTAKPAINRKSQCSRPKRRQRNSFIITGLASQIAQGPPLRIDQVHHAAQEPYAERAVVGEPGRGMGAR